MPKLLVKLMESLHDRLRCRVADHGEQMNEALTSIIDEFYQLVVPDDLAAEGDIEEMARRASVQQLLAEIHRGKRKKRSRSKLFPRARQTRPTRKSIGTSLSTETFQKLEQLRKLTDLPRMQVINAAVRYHFNAFGPPNPDRGQMHRFMFERLEMPPGFNYATLWLTIEGDDSTARKNRESVPEGTIPEEDFFLRSPPPPYRSIPQSSCVLLTMPAMIYGACVRRTGTQLPYSEECSNLLELCRVQFHRGIITSAIIARIWKTFDRLSEFCLNLEEDPEAGAVSHFIKTQVPNGLPKRVHALVEGAVENVSIEPVDFAYAADLRKTCGLPIDLALDIAAARRRANGRIAVALCHEPPWRTHPDFDYYVCGDLPGSTRHLAAKGQTAAQNSKPGNLGLQRTWGTKQALIRRKERSLREKSQPRPKLTERERLLLKWEKEFGG